MVQVNIQAVIQVDIQAVVHAFVCAIIKAVVEAIIHAVVQAVTSALNMMPFVAENQTGLMSTYWVNLSKRGGKDGGF